MNDPLLSLSYRDALCGLQGKASAVNENIGRRPGAKLAQAQRSMAANESECHHILQLVWIYDTTVPELTEPQLAVWLDE